MPGDEGPRPLAPLVPPASRRSPITVEDRPLLTVVRSWPWAPWMVLALVVARVLAVIGLHPYLYVDSGEYGVLDFSGRWRRPWATPLLYRLVPGDHRWEIVAQAALGGVAWAVLALAVAVWFREPRVRLVTAGAVLALGLTTSVTNWDTAILSESLALSLTALVVAAWLTFVRRPDRRTVALVLVATWPWLFVRQGVLPAAWMVVAAVGVAVLVTRRRRGSWRLLAVLAVAMVLSVGLASASYTRNQEVVRSNLTVIVANRVIPDPGRLSWFVDHGMPLPSSGDLGPDGLAADPAFARWVAGAGRGTYARFLVTHPWYTITEPLDDLVGVRRSYGDPYVPEVTMLSPADAYGSARPVIPELVEQVLYQPGATGVVLTAIAGVGLVTLVRRDRRSRRWIVPLVLVGISLASLVVGWHGATPELNRLAIVAAVTLRLGLILQIGFLAEDELGRRVRGPRGPASGVAAGAYPRTP